MKSKVTVTVVVIALLLVPSYLFASNIVFETTGWIIGKEGLVYQFVADKTPLTYKATITDLSISPAFGLEDLFLSVSSSTEVLGFRFGEGSFTFDVDFGATYFANVFANGAGDQEAGNFGLKIEAVPIPAAVFLLGSGLLGLIVIRRRRS